MGGISKQLVDPLGQSMLGSQKPEAPLVSQKT